MESSRIFVRNLPPSLSDSEFRAYFSRGRTEDITDARFFPARRIGYVGYKSADEAARAVKYFNKSFIRMSRIVVELATAYNEEEKKAKQEKRLQSIESKENPLKRKRETYTVQEKGDDPKLGEFLDVMGQSKMKRTWQNEVIDGIDKTIPIPPTADDESEDNLQVIATKKPQIVDSINTVESDDDKATLEITHAQEQSDGAWLRSRKTGLLEDDGANGEEQNIMPESMPIDEAKGRVEEASAKVKTDDDSTVQSALNIEIPPEDKIRESGRLYLRNLPFKTTEDDLREHFGTFGALQEVHLPMDTAKGLAKGYAFLLFSYPEDAVQAYKAMDGKTFRGRLIHILPADQKRDNKLDEYAISQLPLKQQQKIRRKMESATATYKWNPLYMNMDDVMSSISSRLGVPKSELLDATSSDAAVKQALAETHVIQEAKSYFGEHGVDLDSFKPGRQRGDTAILIKNFPFGSTADDLRNLFESYGRVTRLLIPPSGTMALVEFAQATEGRAAFASLKYKRMKDSILFLEKAPKDVFSTVAKPSVAIVPKDNAIAAKLSTTDLLQESTPIENMETSTLFVRNLNFTTTTEKFRETFAPLAGFISAKVKTKPDPKHPGEVLSMGFGFLEFRNNDDAQAALAAMNGFVLEEHKLDVRPSQKILDAGEERRRDEKAKAAQKTKVVVKNVPFETSKKEIRALLGTYGQLRSVRVPKKFDTSSRGFAFAEFTTPREAANAISALRNTHLLGRRLHLEYAEEETMDAEEEIERMQKKIGSQVDNVTIQKLTGSTRKRFNVGGGEVDQG